jgi:hypothetical protein
MRQKVLLSLIVSSVIILMGLMALSPVRNVSGQFLNPVVTVTPSEAEIGQEVLVQAKITVASG